MAAGTGTTSQQALHPIINYSFNHISANATTLVKTGIGVLDAVTINTKGAASNTLTLYDGIDNTGTVIAIIDTTLAQTTLVYDLQFVTGLCAVSATGTCADITITYF